MLVSVVIPAYNAGAWLGETLQSVLRQTYRNFEVIVVDDGSRDDTALVAEKNLSGAAIPYRIECQANAGPSAARNRGWRAAVGEWIQFLDADDILHPSKFRVQIECGERMPDAVIYSDWGRLTNVVGEWRADASRRPLLARRPAVQLVQDRNFVHLGSQMFPSRWLRAVGGFDESRTHGEDVDLNIRIALAGGCFFKAECDGALFWYRDRMGSLTKSNPREFAEGCFRNARLVARSLEDLEQADIDIIAEAYLCAARGLARHDWLRFLEVAEELEALRPGFVPSSPTVLNRLSAAIGYREAERCAVWYGRAKAKLERFRR